MTPVEMLAKHAAYMRAYTRKNRDKINSQRRARRTAETLACDKKWRAKNRDKVLGYKKRDREKRPDDYRRWKQKWAERNTDKLQARSRADYKANKNKMAARLKTFRAENPDRYKKSAAERSMRRRARLAKVTQEPVDRDVVYDRDGGTCQLCHRKVSRKRMSVDHIIPIIYGGPHTYDNIQLTHVNCNKRRGHRGPAQLRLSL